MATTGVRLVKVEDREGDGRCQECGREGLRWIARLSNGLGVGLECSKKVMGYRPAAVDYEWVALYDEVARFTECGDEWVLYQRRGGVSTRDTRNGHGQMVGGAREAWQHRGWL